MVFSLKLDNSENVQLTCYQYSNYLYNTFLVSLSSQNSISYFCCVLSNICLFQTHWFSLPFIAVVTSHKIAFSLYLAVFHSLCCNVSLKQIQWWLINKHKICSVGFYRPTDMGLTNLATFWSFGSIKHGMWSSTCCNWIDLLLY